MEESATVDLISTIVPFAIIVFVIAIGVVYLSQQFQKKIFEQRLEKEGLKIKQQQKLLQVSIQAQEQERKRIARDLHDELGASLSISRMLLKQLEDEGGAKTDRIQDVREIIESTLASTRKISHELMPLQLSEIGFKKALCSFADKVRKIGKVTINIGISQDNLELPWELEIGLYRIYIELINNTLKHANATNIQISIFKENNFIFCGYSDDGIGITNKKLDQGIGLQNLESRILALNGSIDFGDEDTKGFNATFKIPLLLS